MGGPNKQGVGKFLNMKQPGSQNRHGGQKFRLIGQQQAQVQKP